MYLSGCSWRSVSSFVNETESSCRSWYIMVSDAILPSVPSPRFIRLSSVSSAAVVCPRCSVSRARLREIESTLAPVPEPSMESTRCITRSVAWNVRVVCLMNGPSEGPFIKQTTRTLQATERVMQRVDSMLGSGTGANVDSISRNLARLTEHLGHTTAALDTLLSRMNRGEGTLGRMASDTMMYHDLHELSVSLTKLLTDLQEHPDKYMKPGLIRVKLF